jgi:hypothetical protein
MQQRLGKDGLAALGSLLRAPSGTLRFTLNQALAFKGDATELTEQMERWVDVVCRVREARMRNAILSTGAGQATADGRF